MSKYYKGFTESIKKYQKSDSYKKYRRGYEAYYRDDNRLQVNYNVWKSMSRINGKRITPQKEMNYLLERML